MDFPPPDGSDSILDSILREFNVLESPGDLDVEVDAVPIVQVDALHDFHQDLPIVQVEALHDFQQDLPVQVEALHDFQQDLPIVQVEALHDFQQDLPIVQWELPDRAAEDNLPLYSYSDLEDEYEKSGLPQLLPAVPLVTLVVFPEYVLRHYLRTNHVISHSRTNHMMPTLERYVPFLRALSYYRLGRGAREILSFSFEVGAREWRRLRHALKSLKSIPFGEPALRAVRKARETWLSSRRTAARRHRRARDELDGLMGPTVY